MNLLSMKSLNLSNQRVLIRSDLNVPVTKGTITSEARIQASLPTYQQALKAGAAVMVMSHLGRPEEGRYQHEFSLTPVADCLSRLLEQPVRLIKNWLTESFTVEQGEIVLLENVRFNVGEKNNAEALAKQMAKLCDIYVMDAFGTAHRAQASTHGVGMFAPIACAGPLLMAELKALGKVLQHPQRPLLAIVGGAKVSSKLSVLESLSDQCDQLIPGGGIANTFLAAAGYPTGRSLVEKTLLLQAKALMKKMHIPLPSDVVVASEISQTAVAQVKSVNEVSDYEMILDIGPQTQRTFEQIILKAQTILWNGPVGVFELEQFSQGTQALSQAIAKSSAFSVAGGGDTLSAIEKYRIKNNISYISTGGGAFLEYVEGKTLPAVAMLENRNKQL